MGKLDDKLQVEFDVTEWMKDTYGSKVPPEVKKIVLVQDENKEKTYVKVVRDDVHPMGTFTRIDAFDLDVAEDEDGSHPYADSKPVEVIADELFKDEETLKNITNIFDRV